MPFERIATLESKLENQGEDLDEIKDDVRAIRADVQAIREGLQKQKGFIAGGVAVIVFIWSIVAGTVAVMWDKIVGTWWP